MFVKHLTIVHDSSKAYMFAKHLTIVHDSSKLTGLLYGFNSLTTEDNSKVLKAPETCLQFKDGLRRRISSR